MSPRKRRGRGWSPLHESLSPPHTKDGFPPYSHILPDGGGSRQIGKECWCVFCWNGASQQADSTGRWLFLQTGNSLNSKRRGLAAFCSQMWVLVKISWKAYFALHTMTLKWFLSQLKLWHFGALNLISGCLFCGVSLREKWQSLIKKPNYSLQIISTIPSRKITNLWTYSPAKSKFRAFLLLMFYLG